MSSLGKYLGEHAMDKQQKSVQIDKCCWTFLEQFMRWTIMCEVRDHSCKKDLPFTEDIHALVLKVKYFLLTPLKT